jgi:transcriptional regulator with XRE-family HTH domain
MSRLREAAGMTIEQAASTAGISASHLSRIERAHVGVRVPVVKALLATYGADAETTGYLIEVAKEASQRGWWHPYAGTIPEGYATYIGFEADAEQIWNFDASTMPGLLQTEAYARAMFQRGWLGLPDEEITRRVEVRMQRQAILTRLDPPKVWFILDEAVIRRPVGGRGIFADQLLKVGEIASLPHVDIQVMPFAVGAHPGTPGAFVVLQFMADPAVVYIETMAGDLFPESQDDVSRAILTFDRLRALALGPDESVAMIREAAKEIS